MKASETYCFTCGTSPCRIPPIRVQKCHTVCKTSATCRYHSEICCPSCLQFYPAHNQKTPSKPVQCKKCENANRRFRTHPEFERHREWYEQRKKNDWSHFEIAKYKLENSLYNRMSLGKKNKLVQGEEVVRLMRQRNKEAALVGKQEYPTDANQVKHEAHTEDDASSTGRGGVHSDTDMEVDHQRVRKTSLSHRRWSSEGPSMIRATHERLVQSTNNRSYQILQCASSVMLPQAPVKRSRSCSDERLGAARERHTPPSVTTQWSQDTLQLDPVDHVHSSWTKNHRSSNQEACVAHHNASNRTDLDFVCESDLIADLPLNQIFRSPNASDARLHSFASDTIPTMVGVEGEAIEVEDDLVWKDIFQSCSAPISHLPNGAGIPAHPGLVFKGVPLQQGTVADNENSSFKQNSPSEYGQSDAQTF